jgi:hypothetical protein
MRCRDKTYYVRECLNVVVLYIVLAYRPNLDIKASDLGK